MHIVVMGAGGVGGYFGAKLARAGESVTLVVRGEHLAAIRRDGLRLRSAVEGAYVVRPAAVDDVRDLSGAAVARAPLDAQVSTDVRRRLWEQYALICAVAGMTALTRSPIGVIRETPECWRMFGAIVEETVALAAASKAGLPVDTADQIVKMAASIAPGNFSSLYQDLRQGKRLELEALQGHAVRLGERFGVPTPALAAVYAALKPHAAGRRD